MRGITMFFFVCFFSSRRRHTRYWRDWSSDVCSSDLQESLYADDREVLKVVDRLVEQIKLFADQGRTKVKFQFDASPDLTLHLGVEEDELVLASGLGLVERDVGVAQQLAAARAIAHGDADAGTDREGRRRSVEVEGLAHDVEESLGDDVGSEHVFAAVDQNDELVATHSTDRVDLAQGLTHPLCDGDQQSVTDVVSERVIDVLEVIQVHVECRPHCAVATITSEKLLDAVDDERAVRKPRERVVYRLELQLIGALRDEDLQSGPTGTKQEVEDPEHQTEDDAADQQHERVDVAEQPAAFTNTLGREDPSVVQVDSGGLGVRGCGATAKDHGRGTRAEAQDHCRVGMTDQRLAQDDVGHQIQGDNANEGLFTRRDARRDAAAAVVRRFECDGRFAQVVVGQHFAKAPSSR